jgi:hypothetical protein
LSRGLSKRNARRTPGEFVKSRTVLPQHTAASRTDQAACAVITTKANGATVCFGTYDDRAEADRVVTQLAAIGCRAHVDVALADDMPGRQRMPR